MPLEVPFTHGLPALEEVVVAAAQASTYTRVSGLVGAKATAAKVKSPP